jgi:hypothetical protein
MEFSVITSTSSWGTISSSRGAMPMQGDAGWESEVQDLMSMRPTTLIGESPSPSIYSGGNVVSMQAQPRTKSRVILNSV